MLSDHVKSQPCLSSCWPRDPRHHPFPQRACRRAETFLSMKCRKCGVPISSRSVYGTDSKAERRDAGNKSLSLLKEMSNDLFLCPLSESSEWFFLLTPPPLIPLMLSLHHKEWQKLSKMYVLIYRSAKECIYFDILLTSTLSKILRITTLKGQSQFAF